MRFLAINLWCTRNVPAMPPAQVSCGGEPFIVRSIAAADIERFERIHNELRAGKPLSTLRRWLYIRTGSKLIWVAQTTAGEFAGFDMYYFRHGECQERIVHEAFIGVLEEFRGRGLSNALRSAAAEHFSKAGLRGISTQIDRANAASLRSAQRLGFHEAGLNRDGKLPLLLTLPLPRR